MPASRPDLPTFYYVDHFLEMMDFVAATYGDILAPPHHEFIAAFRDLPQPAQCLYVRMTNRKGQVFAKDTLVYEEIGPPAPAMVSLVATGFAGPVMADDAALALPTFSKPDLFALAQELDAAARPSWSKARLLAFVTARATPDWLAGRIALDGYVRQLRTEALAFLLFLYFGRCQTDLKSFALRDLGIVAVHERQDFAPRFDDAAEADACFIYSRWLERLETAADEMAAPAVDFLASFTAAPTDYAVSLRARVAYSAGQAFEKRKAPAAAIDAYRHGNAPECHERLARLLYAAGQMEAAKALLERLIDDPASDEEHVFATDFYARKFGGQRSGLCTELLRQSERIAIDEIYRQAPEDGAASYFRRGAATVYHTENGLWHTLFGLLFWDELFGARAALGSGFDRVPPGLKDGRFARLHQETIAGKLAAVGAGRGLPFILQSVARHWGRPNGLFGWHIVEIEALRDLLKHADGPGLAAILQAMCADFRNWQDGFPDLMVAENGALRFIEIKATGDAVRRNQLTRLRQLQRAGISAQICRVDYRYDPDQTYIVVDIETTGGRPASERITEVGAVKMRGHEVVAEYHSLINPERRIPGYITRLTGISDAMVQDAPSFRHIANDLSAFMADGVFVAHNVNFDYGFIASEYGRLEQPFRYPKFCTCAEMRRHYPGHASYSLANLCEAYGIPLDDHHRALCDARAAGQLLALINRRREAA